MNFKLRWSVKTTVGLAIGILTPLIAIPVVIAIMAWMEGFLFSFLWHKFLLDTTIQSKFISLSIIPNLAWFYLFLNKERYDIARGIIIGSACFLPYVLYINFS